MSSSNSRSGPDRRQLLTAGLTALGGMTLLRSNAQARAGLRLWMPGSEEFTGKAPRTLVLVQLTGGNDGCSMLVPYGDDEYGRARNSTRIDGKDVHKLGDYCGLHPALGGLRGIFDRGELAIVQGAGYPEPIRSHFKAMDVWHTGSQRGRGSGDGWIGKMCDEAWPKDHTAELVVHVGGVAPYSVHSTSHPAVSFEAPASYKWVATREDDLAAYERVGGAGEPAKGKTKDKASDTVLGRLRGVLTDAVASSLRVRRAVAEYEPRKEYPDLDFARNLRVAAALIQAQIGSRVISLEIDGFDTHDNQRTRHDTLMRQLDAGLTAFFDDMRGTNAGDETLVVVFSEFGRRLKENGSRGTDHGVAAPMLVAGTRVNGGLVGRYPSLKDLDDGDLVHTTDFRSVYGSVIEQWFGADHARVLGAKYPLLPLVKAS